MNNKTDYPPNPSYYSSLPSFPFTITFSQIDWAGRIFYSRIFEVVQATMEKFITTTPLKSIATLLQSQEPLPVVVRVEADYWVPLELGDEVVIQVGCEHIGNTSFVLRYNIQKPQRTVEKSSSSSVHAAQVKTVHVLVKDNQKVGVSPVWREILQTILLPDSKD